MGRRPRPYGARSIGAGSRPTHLGGGFAAMYGAGVLFGLLGIGSGAFKGLAIDTFMRLPS
jgi:hypothetical protein